MSRSDEGASSEAAVAANRQVPARLAKLLSAMVATIREPDARERHRDDALGYFGGRGLDARDELQLAGIDASALFTYRSLVRGTLKAAIELEIPRTAELLGERFGGYLDRYFATAMPTSHYLRDVAFEFVELAAPLWASDSELPACLSDLARHELLAFEVAALPRDVQGQTLAEASLDLARPVLFDGACRLARYGFPVHTIDAASETVARETWLFVYRDALFDIRYLELTPLAAAITRALLDGESLGRAVTVACDRLRATLSPETIDAVARLLADYAERGVLKGSRAQPGTAPEAPLE